MMADCMSAALRWAAAITAEFHGQGDAERSIGLPVHPANDRAAALCAHTQLAFFDSFAEPLFAMLAELAPSVGTPALARLRRSRRFVAECASEPAPSEVA